VCALEEPNHRSERGGVTSAPKEFLGHSSPAWKQKWGSPAVAELPDLNGGPSRTRTLDPLIKRQNHDLTREQTDRVSRQQLDLWPSGDQPFMASAAAVGRSVLSGGCKLVTLKVPSSRGFVSLQSRRSEPCTVSAANFGGTFHDHPVRYGRRRRFFHRARGEPCASPHRWAQR
jgi:hypothetical protein